MRGVRRTFRAPRSRPLRLIANLVSPPCAPPHRAPASARRGLAHRHPLVAPAHRPRPRRPRLDPLPPPRPARHPRDRLIAAVAIGSAPCSPSAGVSSSDAGSAIQGASSAASPRRRSRPRRPRARALSLLGPGARSVRKVPPSSSRASTSRAPSRSFPPSASSNAQPASRASSASRHRRRRRRLGLTLANAWSVLEGGDVLVARDGVAPVAMRWLDDIEVVARPPDYLHEIEHHELSLYPSRCPTGRSSRCGASRCTRAAAAAQRRDHRGALVDDGEEP